MSDSLTKEPDTLCGSCHCPAPPGTDCTLTAAECWQRAEFFRRSTTFAVGEPIMNDIFNPPFCNVCNSIPCVCRKRAEALTSNPMLAAALTDAAQYRHWPANSLTGFHVTIMAMADEIERLQRELEDAKADVSAMTAEAYRLKSERDQLRSEDALKARYPLLTLGADETTKPLPDCVCSCAHLSARGTPGDLEIYCDECGKVFRAAVKTGAEHG